MIISGEAATLERFPAALLGRKFALSYHVHVPVYGAMTSFFLLGLYSHYPHVQYASAPQWTSELQAAESLVISEHKLQIHHVSKPVPVVTEAGWFQG